MLNPPRLQELLLIGDLYVFKEEKKNLEDEGFLSGRGQVRRTGRIPNRDEGVTWGEDARERSGGRGLLKTRFRTSSHDPRWNLALLRGDPYAKIGNSTADLQSVLQEARVDGPLVQER